MHKLFGVSNVIVPRSVVAVQLRKTTLFARYVNKKKRAPTLDESGLLLHQHRANWACLIAWVPHASRALPGSASGGTERASTSRTS